MKDYLNASIIIQEIATGRSKANKLLKIAVKTEDIEFKMLLNKLIYAYTYYDEKQHLNERKAVTAEYIQEILKCQVPQWQILAERNGWGPKR